MSQAVCILDYGSGNVGSVFNLMKTLTPHVRVSNEAATIRGASHLILPGVGAFTAAMKKINQNIPLEELKRAVFEKKTPFLGICVGLQVLATKGYEFGESDGLGWIPGSVRRLECGELPLPHIGWNDIRLTGDCSLLWGLEKANDFYFLHSYAMRPEQASDIAAQCDYGSPFACVVGRENIWGVQFHPEKSQKTGAKLMNNFLKMGASV